VALKSGGEASTVKRLGATLLPSLTSQFPKVGSGVVGTLSGDPPINVATPEAHRPQKPITRLTAARLLASIVESSDDAIISKDLNGIVTSWNQGAERLFGYSAKEMIGMPILRLIPPDRHGEEPDILGRIRHGERVEHYETVRRRKDGSLVDVSITVSPVKDSTGKVVGASKIARDITEAKQAQARQEMLIQEIHHRTRNLFAVVHSVVSRSFAGKLTVEEAETAVLGRLRSLAQTHAILNGQQALAGDLTDVIRNEMSPFSGRVTIDGPRLLLVPKAAQNFALAVHELAT
jgi:PAS domain S-box-containing protein